MASWFLITHVIGLSHRIENALTRHSCSISLSLIALFLGWFLAVRLPRFVMRQDVFLRLAIHNIDVVIGKVDWLYPVTGSINYYRDASTCHAARDQHRHQACG